ncbi:MAG: DUF4132 domain-containing protein [Pleurocapsa sp. SU_196_0]|nr:DUF4132 domain-containing protein [Pleurocapsa sp. SU_196_0]
MEKGEFKGRKLSDLKPKTETVNLERQPISTVQPQETAATAPLRRSLSSLQPHEDARQLLEAWCKVSPNLRWDERKLSSQASGKAILEASAELQLEILLEALKRNTGNRYDMYAREVADHLARRTLPHTPDTIISVLEAVGSVSYPQMGWFRNVVKPLEDPATLQRCRPALEVLAQKMREAYSNAETRKFIKLIEATIAGPSGEARNVQVVADEWGTQARTHLETLEPDLRERWQRVVNHAATGSGSTPNQKWLEAARPALEALGETSFVTLTVEWLGFFKHSSNKPPNYAHLATDGTRGCLLDEDNADLLRGLTWLSSSFEHASLAAALADAAIAGYKKISGVGPRSAKIAGAAIHALRTMPGLTAAAQLERVKLNVKQPSYLKSIEEALETAARNAGLSREDLEELTVPTYAFVNGERIVNFGEARIELRLRGLEVDAAWFGADGKPRKSEPSEVKSNFKTELKTLKLEREGIEKMLSAQRDRLERLPLARRAWSLTTWKARYLEHELLSGLVRRLIWHVQDGDKHTDAFWLDGQPMSSDDTPLEFSSTATVTPWHAVHSDANEVLMWREFIARHGITQPFKQAHREVYILTEAERRTNTYSNRFAAHILKQHQFNALCGARGWRNQLRLMVDDSYQPPTLELPLWGLRAEYWVEGAGDQYGVDTNDTGTYLYLSTDQVRFYRLEEARNHAHAGGGGYSPRWRGIANEALPLETIPAVVFSEVLRDVDLFVGVASVGNDPAWLDGGPEGHRTYWQSYSFGDLSASAETRKVLLEALVPRLKIKDVARVEGKFLHVKGRLREYKIHLGSGNILMLPNDQYLCIVPGSAKDQVDANNLRLPFEGDRTLAIILSKASCWRTTRASPMSQSRVNSGKPP